MTGIAITIKASRTGAMDATTDRERLAADHLRRSFRYAAHWCAATDRAWFADEAESSAVDGLLAALDRWGGAGRFETLLYACVRVACRRRFHDWCRERERAGVEACDLASVAADAPTPDDATERAESIRLVLDCWRSIAARNRDDHRVFRLLYGLPDVRRGSRSCSTAPMGLPAAALIVGRSESWVARAEAAVVAEIRAEIDRRGRSMARLLNSKGDAS
jgi:DNA-directed RNA polymerase specialized sigma24 family protein